MWQVVKRFRVELAEPGRTSMGVDQTNLKFSNEGEVPHQSNTYGPGINSDATGRPFVWQSEPGQGPADPLARVRPDAYGPGRNMR
jgi:hypothetical protein